MVWIMLLAYLTFVAAGTLIFTIVLALLVRNRKPVIHHQRTDGADGSLLQSMSDTPGAARNPNEMRQAIDETERGFV
jgi:hypothetical protein